ncbi:MAG: hypothetical protein JSR46_04645 [Verrucomicrobia bacterium]|nr:hypothetical protein [Verrucomicrobiota bacterium]
MLKHWIGYIILFYVAFLPFAKMDLYASDTKPNTIILVDHHGEGWHHGDHGDDFCGHDR